MSTLDELLDRNLSAERLDTYRAATVGDSNNSYINAYIWNIAISAALMEVIAYVEVPLRNALAAELRQMATEAGDGRAWWRCREWFQERSLEDIDAAIDHLISRAQDVLHGRLVAQLNLGFWRYLLDKRHDRTLWRVGLYRAFPSLKGSRQDVYDAAVTMNALRNRIAHHEPILRRNWLTLESSILNIAGWISPEYRDWAAGKSRVGYILTLKPRYLRTYPTS